MNATEDRAISELQPIVLKGKRALVLGIANEHSIAYGCARVFRRLGAEVAITYANDKSRAYVEPLAKELGAPIFRQCDVSKPGDLEAIFDDVKSTWGSLDIALHSIAFAPKNDLHGRVVDSSAEGFGIAMDVSCHSFIRMARLAEPLMLDGGTLLCMTYNGANRVVPNYNLMGPVKAALESVVRYLAFELGDKQIRVHAISPGPLKTRAASGIKDFDQLLNEASERAPIGELVDIDDVGLTTAFLTTPFARRLTGTVTYVDGGLSIMA
jgi:enoyl-[acyl-carrier protein] reductase I